MIVENAVPGSLLCKAKVSACVARVFLCVLCRLPMSLGKRLDRRVLKAGTQESTMARWTSTSDQITAGAVSPIDIYVS